MVGIPKKEKWLYTKHGEGTVKRTVNVSRAYRKQKHTKTFFLSLCLETNIFVITNYYQAFPISESRVLPHCIARILVLAHRKVMTHQLMDYNGPLDHQTNNHRIINNPPSVYYCHPHNNNNKDGGGGMWSITLMKRQRVTNRKRWNPVLILSWTLGNFLLTVKLTTLTLIIRGVVQFFVCTPYNAEFYPTSLTNLCFSFQVSKHHVCDTALLCFIKTRKR